MVLVVWADVKIGRGKCFLSGMYGFKGICAGSFVSRTKLEKRTVISSLAASEVTLTPADISAERNIVQCVSSSRRDISSLTRGSWRVDSDAGGNLVSVNNLSDLFV